MHIDFNMFLQTLPIMGKGMLGIFIVTGAILLVITLLMRFSGSRKR